MCGRKTLTKGKMEIIEAYSVNLWEPDYDFTPSYNIAPTDINPILVYSDNRIIKPMMWGLIPAWVKDRDRISTLINARSETITKKPSFANLVYNHRCVVITDGYYEWEKSNGSKQPYYFRKPDHGFISMAGLWSLWKNPKGNPVYSYTVITTDAREEFSFIHPRMPAILEEDELDIWLKGNDYPPAEALQLLQPYSESLEFYPVSTYVNSVKNNSPSCIEKINSQTRSLF